MGTYENIGISALKDLDRLGEILKETNTPKELILKFRGHLT